MGGEPLLSFLMRGIKIEVKGEYHTPVTLHESAGHGQLARLLEISISHRHRGSAGPRGEIHVEVHVNIGIRGAYPGPGVGIIVT